MSLFAADPSVLTAAEPSVLNDAAGLSTDRHLSMLGRRTFGLPPPEALCPPAGGGARGARALSKAGGGCEAEFVEFALDTIGLAALSRGGGALDVGGNQGAVSALLARAGEDAHDGGG